MPKTKRTKKKTRYQFLMGSPESEEAGHQIDCECCASFNTEQPSTSSESQPPIEVKMPKNKITKKKAQNQFLMGIPESEEAEHQIDCESSASFNTEQPSTSSESQPPIEVKMPKNKITKKKAQNQFLMGIPESEEAENQIDCESSASFNAESCLLSSIDSNSSKQSMTTRAKKKKSQLHSVTERPTTLGSNNECASGDDSYKNKPDKGKISNGEEENLTAQLRRGAKKHTERSAPESEVSSPGISTRLRRRQIPVVPAETEKENTPPPKRGKPKKTPSVGTQVNPRMLPRTREVTKKSKKKTVNFEDSSASTSSYQPNQQDQLLKAPMKIRSGESRRSDASSSTLLPRSSSPALELISPIPTDSDSNDQLPRQDDTLDGIPSISDDDKHQARQSRGSARRSISVEIERASSSEEQIIRPNEDVAARRSFSVEIERASSSEEQIIQPNEDVAAPRSISAEIERVSSSEEQIIRPNEDVAISNSEPTSSSQPTCSASQQITSEGLVINCHQSGLSIKLSSEILKNVGEIRIGKNSHDETRSHPKLSFIDKLSGRNRRVTSWSSSSESSDDSSSDSSDDSSSTSATESYTSSEEDATSSYIIRHSKTTCRRCGNCDYCCVCRR